MLRLQWDGSFFKIRRDARRYGGARRWDGKRIPWIIRLRVFGPGIAVGPIVVRRMMIHSFIPHVPHGLYCRKCDHIRDLHYR
jgi:hypothetical protein